MRGIAAPAVIADREGAASAAPADQAVKAVDAAALWAAVPAGPAAVSEGANSCCSPTNRCKKNSN